MTDTPLTPTERYNAAIQATYAVGERMRAAKAAWKASNDDDALFEEYFALRLEHDRLEQAAEDAYRVKAGGYAQTVGRAR